jgi:ribosomal protein S18 acetylase RimI-like enzyme
MPRKNKQVRAATRKALNHAEKRLCDKFINRKITMETNNQIEQIKINHLIEVAHDKVKPFMDIAIKVQEQGRSAANVCSCAYALAMLWDTMYRLRYTEKNTDIRMFLKLYDYIEVVFVCMKNKFDYKDNVALIILSGLMCEIEVNDNSGTDEYYKKGRDILCLKTDSGECNGFVMLREPKNNERPLHIEYAMIDKAYRRSGIMTKCLINIDKRLSTTGVSLYVHHDNYPMINLMKKIGAVDVCNNKIDKVSTYHYKS